MKFQEVSESGPTLKTLPSAAQIGVMSNVDWLLYQQALDAIQYTKEFVVNIKKNNHTALKDADVIRELIETPLSHGSDVSPARLAGYGLPNIHLDGANPLWPKLTEYFTRVLKSLQMEVQGPPGATGLLLFESPRVNMTMNAILGPLGKPG